MGIEGKGANHEIERVEGGEKSESGSEVEKPDFGAAFVASFFKNETHVQKVGEDIGDEKGDAVISGRALEAELVAHGGIEGGVDGVTKNIDEGPVKEESGAATEEVFAKLKGPRGQEGEKFLKEGGHLRDADGAGFQGREKTRC